MAAFLAGIYLFSGCKKNVGPINSILRYDVSGFVSDADAAAIAGVEIFQDGTSVTTTDALGKYTLPKLLKGTYQIEAKKSGYTKGRFSLVVTDAGATATAILLKKLAPPVAVPVTGGTVTATTTSGAPAAEIAIPAGTLSAPVTISVTVLSANEAPKVTEAANKAPGVILSIDCSDPTITFPQGITLTFNLPFTQRPGSKMQVVTFNETTKVWDTYTDAVVGSNGKSASITIYHFSEWAVLIPFSFSKTEISVTGPTSITPAASIEWSSVIDFREGMSFDIDISLIYGEVQSKTNLRFSAYKVSNVQTNIGNGTIKNMLALNKPVKTEARDWELFQYVYLVKATVGFMAYNLDLSKETLYTVNCWYEMPSYLWLLRSDTSYAIPGSSTLSHDVVSVSQVNLILQNQHQGGSGS